MSRPVDKRTGEQIQADTLARLNREPAREDAAAPARAQDPLWTRQGVAVDVRDCPTWYSTYRGQGRCQCAVCAVCGYQKHTAIHGGVFGDAPGGRPYGHEFVAKEP